MTIETQRFKEKRKSGVREELLERYKQGPDTMHEEERKPAEAIMDGVRRRIDRLMRGKGPFTEHFTGPAAALLERGAVLTAGQSGLLTVFYSSHSNQFGRVFPIAKSITEAHQTIKGKPSRARIIRFPGEFKMGSPISNNFKEYQARLAAETLGFGDPKTGIMNADAMAICVHHVKDAQNPRDEAAWMEHPEILPLMNYEVPPNMQALHYGSELFEGMSCEYDLEGNICIFNMKNHWRRLCEGARELDLPTIPFAQFEEAIMKVVQANKRFIPPYTQGRLYIRPNVFDGGPKVKVGHSKTTVFSITCTPIANGGAYMGSLKEPKVLGVPINRVRSTEGLPGDIKQAGNYAQTILAIRLAEEKLKLNGVLFLDRVMDEETREEEAEFTETHASNLLGFRQDKDGVWELHTPPLNDGDILPGLTRALILKIAGKLGVRVMENPMTLKDAREGKFKFMAACGTAAYITPIHGLQLFKIGTCEQLEGIAPDQPEGIRLERTAQAVGEPIKMWQGGDELFPEILAQFTREMERIKRGESDDSEYKDLITKMTPKGKKVEASA